MSKVLTERAGPRTGAASVTVLALLIVAGAGCSSFNSAWKHAASAPGAANDIQGRWAGVWLSQTNGHTGKLRCLMSKKTEGEYQARFHAKYRKILSFGYTVPLAATNVGSVYHFQGDADLGWYAGGLYHYDGQATPTNFFSVYRSKHDGGVFQMQRPERKQ